MILQQPYPIEKSPLRRVITSVAFGIFVFLFLRVLQPFDLNLWQTDHKTLRIAGYGMVTTVAMLFSLLVIPPLFPGQFREEKWKVWKEILWVTWLIVFIASGNLLYSHAMGIAQLNMTSYLNFLFITLLVGILPCTIVILANYTVLVKKNALAAQGMNEVIRRDQETIQPPASGITQIILTAENGKDRISMAENDLLFIASADNYVTITYHADGKIKREILRKTLKSVAEEMAAYPFLFRCHRSYVVNLNNVTKVSGNSQGYKLHFEGVEDHIPVSRNLNADIRQKIKSVRI